MKAILLLKSLLHNVGVLIVGFALAFVGRAIDALLGISRFHSVLTTVLALLLLAIGFLLRLWATYLFYERHMKVISLVPQQKLITSGPFSISRNPLYLGGNVFIFLGAVLLLGSPAGVVLTAVNVLAVDFMIRREERQLAQQYGEAWTEYANRVRRWL